MPLQRTAAGLGGAGAGAIGYAAFDRLLEHGQLGLLTFGVLAFSAMFFGWLSTLRRPRAR